MVGLWIFKMYKYGRTGNCPMDKKPFKTKIFFTFDSLDNFKNKASKKYRAIYPDYCIIYNKIFGTVDHY